MICYPITRLSLVVLVCFEVLNGEGSVSLEELYISMSLLLNELMNYDVSCGLLHHFCSPCDILMMRLRSHKITEDSYDSNLRSYITGTLR